MQIRPEIKEKIVLALDVDTLEQAKSLITELKDYVGVFKVGLQLYTGCGLEVFKFMQEQNIKFFFDVKLHDIPNTVAKAADNVIRNGASFFNIHTTGGEEMMRTAQAAARKTAAELGFENPVILGVTVLTSISENCLRNELKIPYKPDDYAIHLAISAKNAGLDGVVASVWEAKKIKQVCGKNFKVLCPGIRPEWSNKKLGKKKSPKGNFADCGRRRGLRLSTAPPFEKGGRKLSVILPVYYLCQQTEPAIRRLFQFGIFHFQPAASSVPEVVATVASAR